MTTEVSAPQIPITFGDLKRHPDLAPQQKNGHLLTQQYSALVFGVASALLPNEPAAHERIVWVAFDLLAHRWKRVPKKTTLAAWLLRTAWFAVQREQRALARPKTPLGSELMARALLTKYILRLSPKLADLIVLVFICQNSIPGLASAWRIKEATLAARAKKGFTRIEKLLRHTGVTEAPIAVLQSLAVPLPPDLYDQLRTHLQTVLPAKPLRSPLFKNTLRSWRWLGFRRFWSRVLNTLAGVITVMIVLGLTFFWLATNGFLTLWSIRNNNRRLAKEMPEILQPARPWPATTDHQISLPNNSSSLYTLTNIWLAKLSFTSDAWKHIKPSATPPVRRIHQPDGSITLRNPKAQRSGLSGVLGFDFNWAHGNLEFAGQNFPDVAVRFRGNGTYVNSLFGNKQSFKVDLNKFTKGQSFAGIHTLNFLNAIADNSYLHDTLGEQLFRDLGVPGPRTAYAYLTVDAPGALTNQALGLYVLMENIDADFAADRFKNKATPIFKPVTPYLFKDLGDNWKSYADIYDLKTKATPEQLDRVVQFSKLLTHATDDEFSRRLAEFLDLEEFASFLAGHVLLSSYDGFLANGQNYYIYLDPLSSKFGFISWDQDHAWGEFPYVGDADSREKASLWEPSSYQNRFLQRVLKVEAFRTIYRSRIESALTNYFNPDYLFPRIDHLASLIRPAVAAESDFRLKRFDQSVSTNWVTGPRDGRMEGPKSPVHQIKRFVTNRTQSLREQLDGKSKGRTLRGMNIGKKNDPDESSED